MSVFVLLKLVFLLLVAACGFTMATPASVHGGDPEGDLVGMAPWLMHAFEVIPNSRTTYELLLGRLGNGAAHEMLLLLASESEEFGQLERAQLLPGMNGSCIPSFKRLRRCFECYRCGCYLPSRGPFGAMHPDDQHDIPVVSARSFSAASSSELVPSELAFKSQASEASLDEGWDDGWDEGSGMDETEACLKILRGHLLEDSTEGCLKQMRGFASGCTS